MQELAAELADWLAGEETFALATVVGTAGSAPRQPGAAMAVHPSGEIRGSVSGGCVEAAVVELATEVMAGAPAAVHSFGVADADAFAVGLTCGGSIDLFVEAVDGEARRLLAEAASEIAAGRPACLVTAIGAPTGGSAGSVRHLLITPEKQLGSLGDGGLDDSATLQGRGLLAQGRSQLLHFGAHGEPRREDLAVFVESFREPAPMLLFGAIDFAAALARAGTFLGYRVVVCDARPAFTTRSRFPNAAEVVVDWPHRYLAAQPPDPRTVVCVLTHDAKFDVPLLEVALRRPAAYVGAMGSRRTHADRVARLRAAGLTEGELSRLHSPIGLDIGARTPAETAISIAAEIVSARWSGSGRPLSSTGGPIHHALGAMPA